MTIGHRTKKRRAALQRAHRILRQRVADIKTPAQESPWNSLEIITLIVGAATPFALASLSYVISQTSEQNAIRREESLRAQAETREKQRHAESLAREAQARAEARKDATLAREEGRRDAKIARDEAFSGERILRFEAAAHQNELRRRTLVALEWQNVTQRRHEGWSKIGPTLYYLDRSIASLAMSEDEEERNFWQSQVFTKTSEVEENFSTYLSYFGPYFADQLADFLNECLDVARAEKISKADLAKAADSVNDAYRELRDVASIMLISKSYETSEDEIMAEKARDRARR